MRTLAAGELLTSGPGERFPAAGSKERCLSGLMKFKKIPPPTDISLAPGKMDPVSNEAI